MVCVRSRRRHGVPRKSTARTDVAGGRYCARGRGVGQGHTLTGERKCLHLGHDILVQSSTSLCAHGCLWAGGGPINAAARGVDLAQVRGGGGHAGGGIAGG